MHLLPKVRENQPVCFCFISVLFLVSTICDNVDADPQIRRIEVRANSHHRSNTPSEELREEQPPYHPRRTAVTRTEQLQQQEVVSSTTTQNPQQSTTTADECHACEELKREMLTPLTEEELRRARLEEIKEFILEKLRMESPPNVTGSVNRRQLRRQAHHQIQHVNRLEHQQQQQATPTEQVYAETNSQLIFSTSGKYIAQLANTVT